MFISISKDFFCFLPEIYFGFICCVSLLFYSFFSIFRINYINKTFVIQNFVYGIILQLFLFIFILFIHNPLPYITAFFGCLVYDIPSSIVKNILVFFIFVVLVMSKNYFNLYRIFAFEYFVLILFSCFSLLLLIQSNDFLSFYLTLELQALCFYALASFKRNSAYSVEAGLKYFILGAFSSGVFLFGCSMLYGVSGTTNFIVFSLLFSQNYSSFFFISGVFGLSFVLAGFFFKLTVAPFHMWAVDVYEGAPTMISYFFVVLPKVSFLVVLLRIVFTSFYSWIFVWANFFLFVAFCSMFFGAFGAFSQRKLKRFLVYSSISHIGYIMFSIASGSFFGVSSVFFYIIVYLVMSFGIWSMFFYCVRKSSKNKIVLLTFLEDLRFLAKENPAISFSLLLILFSIAGIPPIAGFYAKMFVFFSTVGESSLFFLAVTFICFSMLGTFYYLRIIKILSFSLLIEKAIYKSRFFYFTELNKTQGFLLSLTVMFLTFFVTSPGFLYIITHRISLAYLSLFVPIV